MGRRIGPLGAIRQHQRSQSPAPSGQHRAGDWIKTGLDRLAHPRQQRRGQIVGVQGRCQTDARRGLHLQRGHHQQRRGGQLVRPPQPRAAAAGQTERSRLAAQLGDPVGKRRRQQFAAIACGRNRVGHTQPAAVLPGGAADAGQGGAIRLGVAVLQRGQTEKDIRRRLHSAKWVAFFQQRRQIGRHRRLARGCRRQHHRRQPRMRAEPRHKPPGLGDPPRRIQRPQFAQQRPRRRQRARGRLVLKRQVARPRPPGGAVQRQRGQFRLQDFRPVERRHAAMQRWRPQPDRHPRRLPPGPSGALVGRRARNPQGGQPCQAGGGVEPGRAPPAAIDDDPHAGNGERGLRDGGRQHHPPSLRRTQRTVLLGDRQIAMQGQHQGAAALERRLRPADFAHPRQKGQNVARLLRQRLAHRAGHRLGQVAHGGEVALCLADVHREQPAQAFDRDRVHQLRETRLVGGGRHRQQAQLRAELGLQLQAERQRQIRFERALMHLVENDRGDAREARVRLQPAHQQPLGDHLDAGGVRHGAVQPGAKADGGADRFPDQRRHPRGRGTGRQPAWLQHQDAAIAAPAGVQQRQRHKSCLAGAGRCYQYSVAARIQRGPEGGQRIVDGQDRQVRYIWDG